MPRPLLSARERLIWLAGFVLVAGFLVATRFTSADPDSARYAHISEKLSELPTARWIAPEWWDDGPNTPFVGYFREHPAGLFLIPAALARLGIPGTQAAYIFGVAAGLAALLLAACLLERLASREDARAALVLLQIMPVAFVFRVRDNQEYPMLVCLLAALIGLDRVKTSWRWILIVALAFSAGLLTKGVFVVFVLMAAALWILVNPTGGSRSRPVVASIVGLGSMALTAWAYDVCYLHATGGPFWTAYWARQLAPIQVEAPIGDARAFALHIGFYILRLLFDPAPWSLALVWAVCRRRRIPAGAWRERRGLMFALLFTAGSVLMLSVASRFAERYAFSASYVVGAAGSVVAYRVWPTLRSWFVRLDAAVVALPAVVWFLLLALRLVLGPWLPRIGS